MVLAPRDRPQRPFRDRPPSEAWRQGQDAPLYFRGKVGQAKKASQVAWVDAGFFGQRLTGQGGVSGKARREFVRPLEGGLDVRGVELPDLFSENCLVCPKRV